MKYAWMRPTAKLLTAWFEGEENPVCAEVIAELGEGERAMLRALYTEHRYEHFSERVRLVAGDNGVNEYALWKVNNRVMTTLSRKCGLR